MKWFADNWEFLVAVASVLIFIAQRLGWIPTKTTAAAGEVIRAVEEFRKEHPEASSILVGRITEKATAAGVESHLNALVKKFTPPSRPGE